MDENERSEEISVQQPEQKPRTRRKKKLPAENIELTMEEAPSEEHQDNIADRVLGALGIDISKADKAATKLTAKQKAFVDGMSPIVAGAFTLIAAWIWGRAGEEYSFLAPDMEIASQITTPLVRIYARMSKTNGGMINPNIVDAAQSILALVGYINASWGMYQKIKKEQHEHSNEEQIRPYAQDRFSVYRDENTANGQAAHTANGDTHELDAGIPDRYERQRLALARLAQMDYDHRARRAGTA